MEKLRVETSDVEDHNIWDEEEGGERAENWRKKWQLKKRKKREICF
jgi:hypothetical protein